MCTVRGLVTIRHVKFPLFVTGEDDNSVIKRAPKSLIKIVSKERRKWIAVI